MRAANILFLFIFLIFGCKDRDQLPEEYTARVAAEREQKNERFKDPEDSPIPEKELDDFDSLNYYPIDPTYKISAKFVKTPWDEPFQMPSTGKKTSYYVRYGIAKLEVDDQPVQLSIYENLEEKQQGKEYFFIPFKDATSGKETYGGGRYLDLSKPEGDSVVVDFNRAYNPYCVYNSNFSCPIPPKENWLNVAIKAGEKNWDY